MSYEEYTDLGQTGFQGGAEKVAPEDEMFHSVYIAGRKRPNHTGVTEEVGKIQIRGVEYNKAEVHMIITHTKDVLANIKRENDNDSIVCFSFKSGAPPWNGTTRGPDGNLRVCPQTSSERAVSNFCNPCRAQIIVAGIYCKADGTPVLTDEGKPVFIFIRGKGTKYQNVSEYLNELYKEDLTPIFEPATDQSKAFEKSVVNNKRFVTKLSVGSASTRHGNEVRVFSLERGVSLPKDSVLSILKLSKGTMDKFNEKFDWSKQKQNQRTQTPEGVLTIDDPPTDQGTVSEQPSSQGKAFSFDDINI